VAPRTAGISHWRARAAGKVLGVPLGAVGRYTAWPMAVGFFAKLALGGLEVRTPLS
jgi:hypothetical protein